MNQVNCLQKNHKNYLNDSFKSTKENIKNEPQQIKVQIDEKTIDQICIIIFPLAFVIFNIAYWYNFI